MVYFFPNRPVLVSIDSIGKYPPREGWVAEPKKNGDRLEIMVDSRLRFLGRYRNVMRYVPNEEVTEELTALRIPSGTQVDGELLHFRLKAPKHFIYIYDIYQFRGRRVTDSFGDRRKRLEDLFGDSGNKVQLAPQFTSDFSSHFKKIIKSEENEGLVLKNLEGKIKFNTKRSPDVWWQIKIRRPHKNYSF